MTLRLVVPKETWTGERRVALDPSVAERFQRLGAEVQIERGAGCGSHFGDAQYEKGAKLVDDIVAALAAADVTVRVQPPSLEEVEQLRDGSVLIGFLAPHRNAEVIRRLRDKKITSFAFELLPRISRAQSMDALSSQAAIAGYKVALMAASLASFFFPMLTTAAGTIRPAKVVVVGAGVAGLQAIATCKRLGAMVEAYDIRAAAKEQVESLGAKLIDTGVDASGQGGYARELTKEEIARQAEVLARHIAAASAVITTAAIPGRPAPKIVTKAMVEAMKPGAVIVDLAAETGGNCELTEPGQTIEHNDVTIHGPLNVPSLIPVHASETYAKNVFNFLSPFVKNGELALDWNDEVIAKSCLTHDGQIRHEPTRKLVG
ncbi:MAG TPA: NAD(P) transhydrogenase subunit alpha [Plasticicumulans sp.]|uniref:NAD(P) transhydrogenase subunit alpha n=1 Tax=Plasticicumulans sp. TaxID=2307179 RepID=UPI002B93457A|nr:NAD(P) transhydrogenase subunit alpha [Plasticicumulans sp.]HMX52368.1 NAD(P) transhydrogenase subunit alpha [Plasticicumulans sp.]HNF64220.1 NAD(P) transhydrogenase subunit alpha [Plasticicumulans sp.]HNG49596.1 NAD(P) transhydrogenase subunit alpha [Plasticicumulans sp.]HNJ07906.1 NAD(P) transhydrogenase subunit alpha [Plasticicumulans sp.]HNO59778.1 NAD(P) transhydrogenase subunit alpha [Plasticicumulans sp.]